MLERLKMSGVQVRTVDPWQEDAQSAPREERAPVGEALFEV